MRADLVFAHEFPKSPAIFVGRFGSFRDVAVMSEQRLAEVFPLELLDRHGFQFTEPRFTCWTRRLIDADIVRLNQGVLGEHDQPLNHILQFPHIAGPVIAGQLHPG